MVSWDAFDATANDDDSSEITDDYEDLNTVSGVVSVSSIQSTSVSSNGDASPVRRKRERISRFKYFGGRKNHGPDSKSAPRTAVTSEASSQSATIVPYQSWEYLLFLFLILLLL